MVCLPNGAPLCGDCPPQHLCLGYHRGNAAVLPLRAAKKGAPGSSSARCCSSAAVRWSASAAARRARPAGRSSGSCRRSRARCPPDAVRQALAARGWRVGELLSLSPGQTYFHPCGMAHDRLLRRAGRAAGRADPCFARGAARGTTRCPARSGRFCPSSRRKHEPANRPPQHPAAVRQRIARAAARLDPKPQIARGGVLLRPSAKTVSGACSRPCWARRRRRRSTKSARCA